MRDVRRWLVAVALLASGGTLGYRNWQKEAGGEFELALGSMLLITGSLLVLYLLGFPRR